MSMPDPFLQPHEESHGTRRTILLITGALAVLWLGGLELRGLFAPDEGRYAQIPQAMVATGDWITPRLGLSWYSCETLSSSIFSSSMNISNVSPCPAIIVPGHGGISFPCSLWG